MYSFIKTIVVASFSLFATFASAEETSVVDVPEQSSTVKAADGSWLPDHILFGGVSAHYGGAGHRLNGENPGIGLMWTDREILLFGTKIKNVSVSAGVYKNSETWDDKDHYTTYVAIHYLPWKFLGGQAGITFGAAHGYRQAPVLPVVAPTVCWDYACVLITPPFKESAGAVSLQFRAPF